MGFFTLPHTVVSSGGGGKRPLHLRACTTPSSGPARVLNLQPQANGNNAEQTTYAAGLFVLNSRQATPQAAPGGPQASRGSHGPTPGRASGPARTFLRAQSFGPAPSSHSNTFLPAVCCRCRGLLLGPRHSPVLPLAELTRPLGRSVAARCGGGGPDPAVSQDSLQATPASSPGE